MFENDSDSLESILAELKTCEGEVQQRQLQPISKNELTAVAPSNDDELRDFILGSGTKTILATQEIIEVLLDQIQCNPEAELITSVAEMVGANNKALETITKLHLHREKLKQAKELEIFKQQTKAAIANAQLQRRGPIMTREEMMESIYKKEGED